MNDFLARLGQCLKHMDAQEKQDILQDYREHFEIGLAAGKTEEQIARALGEPEQLAKLFSAMGAAGQAHASRGPKAAARMIGAFLRFKLGGGIAAAALYFICLAAMASLYAASLAVALAGGAMLAVMVLEIINAYALWAITAFFAALLLGSGGVLGCKGLTWLWRRLFGALPLLVRRMMQKSAGKKAIA
jgi:uncharacterized membrane protein